MNMKRMLYLMLLFFTLVPLYVFGAIMIGENEKNVTNILKENLAAVSGAQTLDLNDFCEMRKQEIEMMSQYDYVRGAVLAAGGAGGEDAAEDMEGARQALVHLKTQNNCYENVSVISSSYETVVSAVETYKPDMKLIGDSCERILDGEFYISNVYQGAGNEKLVAAVCGITNRGELIGYVVAEIPMSYFDRYRSSTGLWKDGTLYILDGNYELITAGAPSEDSRQELQTTEEDRESFNEAWNAVDHEKNPSGTISYKMGNSEYLTYYSDISHTDWGIRLSVNVTANVKTSSTFRTLVIIMAVSVTLVLLIAVYIFSRHLVRPVKDIAHVLEEIQDRQNYALRVGRKSRDEMGFLAGKIDSLLDYIEQERYRAQQGDIDPLTGLASQNVMEMQIREATARAAKAGETFALGYLDMDDFRAINNQYGHIEGDHCLQYVASVLDELLGGCVSRDGGDDFYFYVEHVKDREQVKQLAETILKRLNEGYVNRLTGKPMALPCSIGFSVEAGENIMYNEMVLRVDEAAFEAKKHGKNTYRILTGDGEDDGGYTEDGEVRQLLRALRRSVADDCDGFYLCHQPLVDAPSGRIVGAETLVRWQKEPFGEVPPGSFVPLLEDDACFYKLGSWILRQAMTECKPILEKDPEFFIHVNVAFTQMVHPEFKEDVMRLLEETGFPAENLTLELTERCRVLDIGYLQDMLGYFREKGVKIALDDFGTGFSSLSLLRQLPVDCIKIDRSFITLIQTNKTDQAIVTSVLQCADGLGIEVCLEGVENQQLRDYLLGYTARIHQGYFYSRPVRIGQFMELLGK